MTSTQRHSAPDIAPCGVASLFFCASQRSAAQRRAPLRNATQRFFVHLHRRAALRLATPRNATQRFFVHLRRNAPHRIAPLRIATHRNVFLKEV